MNKENIHVVVAVYILGIIVSSAIGFTIGIANQKITSPQIEKCRQADGEYTLRVNGVENVERCKVNKNIEL